MPDPKALADEIEDLRRKISLPPWVKAKTFDDQRHRGSIVLACKGHPQKPVAYILGQQDYEERLANADLTCLLISNLDIILAALRTDPVARVAEMREPSPGLLMSMAIRYDHAIGMPGFYDRSPIGIGKPGSNPGAHARRLASTLTTMTQLWEEVVGQGFYRPERETKYVAMRDRILSSPNEEAQS